MSTRVKLVIADDNRVLSVSEADPEEDDTTLQKLTEQITKEPGGSFQLEVITG